MSIEQKLDILRRALENGAKVSFHFFNPLSEEEASKLSDLFPEFEKVNKEYQSKEVGDFKVFRLKQTDGMEGCIFYN